MHTYTKPEEIPKKKKKDPEFFLSSPAYLPTYRPITRLQFQQEDQQEEEEEDEEEEEEEEEMCTRSPENSNRIVRSPDNSNTIGRSMDPSSIGRSVSGTQGSEGLGFSPRITRESNCYDYCCPAEGTSASTTKSRAAAAVAATQQEQALPFHKGDYFQSAFPTGGDELVPEPLADSVKMEAGPLLSMMEMYHVQCLYSKHWQLREKALGFLIESLDGAKTLADEPLPSFR